MHGWLHRYATGHHAWREDEDGSFVRPCGLVETAFDSDGRYFEGRADITSLLTLDLKTGQSPEALEERILRAYTATRLKHPLIRATTYLVSQAKLPWFRVTQVEDAAAALEEARPSITFLDEAHDPNRFDFHSQNVGRTMDPSQTLTRVFVFPLTDGPASCSDLATDTSPTRIRRLRLLLSYGHEIADGLTTRIWAVSFMQFLRTHPTDLDLQLDLLSRKESIRKALPSAQEDLYPRISGSKARQRWFWALTLILRHVRKPLPVAFRNPLARSTPIASRDLEPIYPDELNYKLKPPLSTFRQTVKVSEAATARLHRLCREVGASIGAGCFVLVAMAMMSLYESRYPDIELEQRRPFIGSFPLNPRPFFGHLEPPDSVMLAFCDGVLLPFLPGSLDVERRFRVLTRLCSKQLAIYQKRAQSLLDPKLQMSSKGAGRLIAMNYIAAVERIRSKLPNDMQHLLPEPQGKYPMTPNGGLATCGVSSLGRSSWSEVEADLSRDLAREDELLLSFVDMNSGVRVRDGEFLVGIAGVGNHISATVSFDGNNLDETLVGQWVSRMQSLLEPASSHI